MSINIAHYVCNTSNTLNMLTVQEVSLRVDCTKTRSNLLHSVEWVTLN